MQAKSDPRRIFEEIKSLLKIKYRFILMKKATNNQNVITKLNESIKELDEEIALKKKKLPKEDDPDSALIKELLEHYMRMWNL